jgi:hypothetical protein
MGEQLIKAFVGIKPGNEQTFYDMLGDNKKMEEAAKQDVAVIKGMWLRIATDNTLTDEQKQAKIAGISSVLSNNQLYNNKILDTLAVELVNDSTLEPIVTAFITKNLLDTPEKSITATERELDRFFLGHPLVPKETQIKIREMVKTYAEDARAAIELNNATTN